MIQYRLIIKPKTSKRKTSIIEDYWDIVGEKYKYTQVEIEKNFKLTKSQLEEIILGQSILHLECLICNFYFQMSPLLRKNLNLKDGYFCDICSEEYKLGPYKSLRKLKVSNSLTFSLTKSTQKTKYNYPDYRGEFNLIKDIALKGGYTYSYKAITLGDYSIQLEIKSKYEEEFIVMDKTVDTLSFAIKRNTKIECLDKNEYEGEFLIIDDLLMKRGINYSIGGWIQSDGSISLNFRPYVKDNSNTKPIRVLLSYEDNN